MNRYLFTLETPELNHFNDSNRPKESASCH